MTDLITENARLRAALAPFAMIADLIDDETEGISATDEFGLFFLNEDDDPVWFAERFSVQKFQEARAALATLAPDAVQEAARVPEVAALIEAAKALHRDMLERAQLKIDTISGEQYRIVNSGRTAWADFDAALRAIAGDRT